MPFIFLKNAFNCTEETDILMSTPAVDSGVMLSYMTSVAVQKKFVNGSLEENFKNSPDLEIDVFT
jgi:hypothetical protein